MQAVPCPVCEGRGTVPQGFYSGNPSPSIQTAHTGRDACRSCGCRGYVLVPETQPLQVTFNPSPPTMGMELEHRYQKRRYQPTTMTTDGTIHGDGDVTVS